VYLECTLFLSAPGLWLSHLTTLGIYPTLSHPTEGRLLDIPSNVWPELAQQQLQGLWQKAGLAVTYVSFCIFNPTRVVCCALDGCSFLKHKLHHQASVNRITIALS